MALSTGTARNKCLKEALVPKENKTNNSGSTCPNLSNKSLFNSLIGLKRQILKFCQKSNMWDQS